MALHFVQTGIALVAGGASILIVAGLVRETLQDRSRGFHLFPEAHESDAPAEKPDEPAATNGAGPFPDAREEQSRARRRSGNGKARASAARQRREERRNKRRSRSKPDAETAVDHAGAEPENL